jgi:hypothetical protein
MKPMIRVVDVGEVSLLELEAMLSAWINAGAPKPVLEGSRDEQAAILSQVASRGDAQMRSVVEIYLRQIGA